MKVITFDAHLIETGDLAYVQDHILEQEPCVAFYKIIYPPGNTGYFMSVANKGVNHAVSIGKDVYGEALAIR